MFCPIYEKSTFKYKIKESIVPSSPNQLLVILLKANKRFWCGLNFPFIWGLGEVIMGYGQSKSIV